MMPMVRGRGDNKVGVSRVGDNRACCVLIGRVVIGCVLTGWVIIGRVVCDRLCGDRLGDNRVFVVREWAIGPDLLRCHDADGVDVLTVITPG